MQSGLDSVKAKVNEERARKKERDDAYQEARQRADIQNARRKAERDSRAAYSPNKGGGGLSYNHGGSMLWGNSRPSKSHNPMGISPMFGSFMGEPAQKTRKHRRSKPKSKTITIRL